MGLESDEDEVFNGMMPVKSSLRPVLRRPRVSSAGRGEMVLVCERVLGLVGVAEWMIVLRDVSDRARMGERRGRKLPGELVAGPDDVDVES